MSYRESQSIHARRLWVLIGSAICLAVTLPSHAVVADEVTLPDRISAARADPLLSVDLNRVEIVSKLMTQWQGDIAQPQRESFKQKLDGLRADRLLAVSLVGSFDGVLEVLYGQEKSNAALSVLAATRPRQNDSRKALGDVGADLVYTPITPCRILDTRVVSGGPGPRTSGTTTAFNAVAASFVSQGGSATNCNIPAGAAAMAGTFAMLSATSLGYVGMWAVDSPQPTAATGLFNPSTQQSLNSSSAIVPLCTAAGCTAGKQFNVFVAGSAIDVTFDVTGYFKAPSGVVGDITEIQTAAGSGLTGAATTGIANLSLASTYKLPQACSTGQVPKFNATTSLWQCQNDNTGSGTVTSVGGGAGIVATGPNVVGGAIVSSGLIELANGYILPQGCTPGQVPKSAGGGAWSCAADNAGSGTVSSITLGDGLTDNIALPFTSGGTITTTGSITLPIPYRLPQACNIGQVPIKTFGTWGCVDGPKKFINIGVTGVVLDQGATFSTVIGAGGGVALPSSVATPTPRMAFSFMMPPDYTPGGSIEVKFVWNSASASCTINLRKNFFSLGRPGSLYAVTNGEISVVGGDLLATPATIAQSVATTLAIAPATGGGGAFLPGDAMVVGMFRDARAGAGDTCAGNMRIQGISVTYQ